MGNFFHSPRKVTGQNLDKFKVPCKCDRSDYKYQPVTAEGELTLEGVYEQFLLDMQNDRHWAKSTCIAYDREFWRSVAPIFRGIPYADLNEELAEKLWMERGQFGLGDRIIEQNAKKIFSCIVEQAYQHDLSQMRFWGNVDVELCKNGLAHTAEGQKHLFNLAHKLLKRPKSLPISVVIRIYEEMISRADRFGECVALLAMLLLGLRTSEAAGLSYGDIRQMDEELYAIERRYVEKQSSRDVQVGGKTSNSYRLLPLVKEFRDFLMERKRKRLCITYSSFKRPMELGCTAAMREETRLAADMAEKSRSIYTSVGLFEKPELVDSMPEAEDLEREWLPEVVDAEGNPYPCSQQADSSKKKSKSEAKEGICEEELLAVLSGGRLVKVPENRWLCKPGVCSMGLDKKLQVKRIVVFRQSVDKVLVSSSGQAWYLPASLTVDDFCKNGRWQKCHEALLEDGVLTECNPKDTSLVCAAQSGRQVRLPLDQVRVIPDGMQIVRTGGEKIVTACCSTAEDELLFVSHQGKALRVPVQAMHEYKNLGIGLVSGMKLKTGDSLCQLMVYRPEHKLIIVTEKGRGLVLLPDTAEKRMIEPKLGLGEGVQLIQWGHGGDAIDTLYAETGVLLVTKQGKAHCHDLSDVTPQNRGTTGHWWITNHDVVGVVEMSIAKATSHD
mgnify:CR=1 FL=1